MRKQWKEREDEIKIDMNLKKKTILKLENEREFFEKSKFEKNELLEIEKRERFRLKNGMNKYKEKLKILKKKFSDKENYFFEKKKQFLEKEKYLFEKEKLLNEKILEINKQIFEINKNLKQNDIENFNRNRNFTFSKNENNKMIKENNYLEDDNIINEKKKHLAENRKQQLIKSQNENFEENSFDNNSEKLHFSFEKKKNNFHNNYKSENLKEKKNEKLDKNILDRQFHNLNEKSSFGKKQFNFEENNSENIAELIIERKIIITDTNTNEKPREIIMNKTIKRTHNFGENTENFNKNNLLKIPNSKNFLDTQKFINKEEELNFLEIIEIQKEFENVKSYDDTNVQNSIDSDNINSIDLDIISNDLDNITSNDESDYKKSFREVTFSQRNIGNTYDYKNTKSNFEDFSEDFKS